MEDGLVGPSRMAGDIGSIVCQRAQGECVFVSILALPQQLLDEVATSDVVNQITEFHAAKRIVTEVLNDGAAIGVTVRLGELCFRQVWKSLQKKRPEFAGPDEIDDFSSCVSTE